MRTPDRTAAVAVALLAGLLLAVPAVADEPTPSPSASPTATPSASETPTESPTADDAVDLDDAVLRWGLNNESSNRAFAPRTYNFFSAGLIPDPGKGGTTLSQSRWRQSVGDVDIQKWNGAAWRKATWSGLSTDSAGDPLGSPTSGTFSNHRFVFSGGSGEVDAEAGTAHLEWDGDLTVLYYSGMSFFHISDPVLDVEDGRGTLTATVRGYASSITDPDSWAPVAKATVTLADLPDVDLDDERGFTTTPAYVGVAVDGVGQIAGGSSFGAFPQSFVTYMDRLGTAAFWVSSGASTDPFKVVLPLSVGYDASVDLPEPTPTQQPTLPPIDNPAATPAPVQQQPSVPLPAAQPVPPAVVPPMAVSAPVAAAPVAAAALPNAVQLVAASPQSTALGAQPESGANAVWWLGGVLLLLAALTLLIPVGVRVDPREGNLS